MTSLKLWNRPTLRVRLRTAWRAAELDEALANGADPVSSGELALKAAQLVEPGKRARLADSIELVMEEIRAGGPSLRPGPAILRRKPVARNLTALGTLVRRLRDEDLHCLRGLAMADRTVEFGDSPLYIALDQLELRYRIEEILAALEPDWDGQPADAPRWD